MVVVVLAMVGVAVALPMAIRATTRVAARARLSPPPPGAFRRRAAEVAGLPVVLEDVTRALRSGTSLLRALEEAGTPSTGAGLAVPRGEPVPPGQLDARAALGAVVAQVHRGVPLADAASTWAATASGPEASDVTLAAVALAMAADGGLHAARALDGVVATLRERAAIAADVRVQSAQARLSAAVIAVLPLAFAGWSLATDRRVAAFLVTTPAGLACVFGGLLLDAAGAWWMARLVRSVH